MISLLIKSVAVWVLLAAGEILNGNFRVRYLHGKLGDKPAKKISFCIGLTIIYVTGWLSMPWLNPKNLAECFLIGFIWMILMLSLDIYFGRFVFRFTWQKILEDFDLRKGNLLGLGMLLLLICPALFYLAA